MRIVISILAFFIFSFSANSQSKSSSDVYVEGYYRSNGTYVKPHYRSAPNYTNRDNFSTKGNTNPYTGKKGTVKPDNKKRYDNTYYPSSQNLNYSNSFLSSKGKYTSREKNSITGVAIGYMFNRLNTTKKYFNFGSDYHSNSSIHLDVYLRKALIGFKWSFDELSIINERTNSSGFNADYVGTQSFWLSIGRKLFYKLFAKISIGIRSEDFESYSRDLEYDEVDFSLGFSYPIWIGWFGLVPEINLTKTGYFGYGVSLLF